MVAALRQAGIRAEMYLGGSGMKAQMKYADRRGSPAVVIQGGDERARGEVQIKDLIEGARLAGQITDNAEWRAARPAQVTVPEGELVATVKKILAAQRRIDGKPIHENSGGRRRAGTPLACRPPPPKGGDWSVRASASSGQQQNTVPTKLLISPLEGEMSGRTEGGAYTRRTSIP